MEETANSEAIRLAQASDWKGLQRLLERDPAVAKERGDHGMLPIHWACTVRRVPLSLVAKLLQAYPDGVRTQNAGELLPLHIAIRARVHSSVLRKLVRAYPDAVHAYTPDGVSALQLAEQAALDADCLKVLYRAQDRSSLIQQQHDEYSSSVDPEVASNNDPNNGQDEGEVPEEDQIEDKEQGWTAVPKPFAIFGGYLHHSDVEDFEAAQMSVLEPEDSISMLSERSSSDDEGLDSPHDHLVSPSSTSTCSQDGVRTPSSSRSSFAAQLGAGIRALSGLQSPNQGEERSQRRISRTVSLLGQLQSNGLLSERELRTMVSAMSESAAAGTDEEATSRSRSLSHSRHMSLPLMPSYENLRQNANFHQYYNEADEEEYESENASPRDSGSVAGRADNQTSRRGRFFQSPKQRPQSRHSTTTGSHRGSPPLFRRSHRRASHGSHSRGHYESPPEWKHDDECSICRASFGMFKHRHHCRNCGKSICSQHSADKKLSMEAKGFTTPQRVCVTCYAMITHSRTLKHDLELEEMSREDSLLNPVAFQQQHYGLPTAGYGDHGTSAAVHPTLRSTAPPGGARSSPVVSPTTSAATAPNVSSRKSSLLAAGEATGGAGERATTATHASGLAGSSGGSTSTIQELRCLLASQQKQIEQLAQSNMQMQQQLLEQEELKAETMLLITQLMTRVSVLELHNDNSRRSSKRRSAGTGDSEDDDDEEYPQDDTLAFER